MEELQEVSDLIASYIMMAKLTEENFFLYKDQLHNSFIQARWNGKEMVKLTRRNKVELDFYIRFHENDLEMFNQFIDVFEKVKPILPSCSIYTSNNLRWSGFYQLDVSFRIGKKIPTTRWFKNII
jgi:hypothetical protein